MSVEIAAGILAACGGFLLAVLWMDLMFDVQVLGHRREGELPEAVLASIATYYHRVTTTASPMGRLIGAVMAVAVITAAAQCFLGRGPLGSSLASLVLCAAPATLALARVHPRAVRLGARSDAPARQSELARSICRDHLLCLAAILAFLVLQLRAVIG